MEPIHIVQATPPQQPLSPRQKRSHKKLLIAIIMIVAVLLVAGGTVTILALTKGSSDADNALAAKIGSGPPAAGTTFKPDLSKNYGACDVVSKDIIKSSIGAVAATLQGPNDLGRVKAGKGDDSQICVYGFASAPVSEQFGINNGFNVQVYIYHDQTAADAAKNDPYKGSVEVSNLGEKAWYVQTKDEVAKLTSSSLTVFSGIKYYKYTIIQTTSDTALSSTVAQTALTAISKSASY